MTGDGAPAEELADRLPKGLADPWELFVERSREYEIHLVGGRVEMRRGPIEVEGFGVRLFRRAGDRLGVGTASAAGLEPPELLRAVASAESVAGRSPTPARSVELPAARTGPDPSLKVQDRRLWETPEESLEEEARALTTAFDGQVGAAPSFGSIRARLSDYSVRNSAGARAHWAGTFVDLEVAVTASGGPEGRAPGEYWVRRSGRALAPDGYAAEVVGWCDRARDAQRAEPTPSGLSRIALGAPLLSEILPAILGYRFSGAAQVRSLAPEAGSRVASELVSMTDEGRRPGSLGTAPADDEGTPHGTTPLIDRGQFVGTIADAVHAGATDRPRTGHGHRGSLLSPVAHRSFSGLQTMPTTLVIAPGSAGTDEELLEAVGDGLWLDQLGYPFPDATSASFGGEIRLGYRIRNGRRAEPLRGGVVGGLVLGPAPTRPLLDAIAGVGSTAREWGTLVSPMVWLDGFEVSGSG